MAQKKKTFDCIEMKRRIQERIQEETKGMSAEELIAYVRRGIAESEFAWFLDLPDRTRPEAQNATKRDE